MFIYEQDRPERAFHIVLDAAELLLLRRALLMDKTKAPVDEYCAPEDGCCGDGSCYCGGVDQDPFTRYRPMVGAFAGFDDVRFPDDDDDYELDENDELFTTLQTFIDEAEIDD